jgi:hypothetical protein
VLVLAGLLVAGVLAVVVALMVTGGAPGPSTGDDDASAGGAQRVRLHAVGDYDPDGDGSEHPETVAAATDGDSTTYWTTELYSAFAKPGVGIVLDARSEVELSQLTVFTDAPGFEAEIRASNESDRGFKKISESQSVEAQTTFELSGGSYRYYLIWITDPNGRAHVNEVRARR